MKSLLTLAILSTIVFAPVGAWAQWVDVNGQGGSHVSSLVKVGSAILAGTNNGVIASNDSGFTWTEVGLEKDEIYWLAAIGTNIFATSISDLFRSTDSGLSWILADSNLPAKITWNCPIVSNSTNLFVGTSMGVFRSSDLGTSWVVAGLSNAAVSYLAISDTNIVALTDSGVFLSTNEGGSWSPDGLTNGSVNAVFIAGDTLFAGTYGGYNPARIFVSTDLGKNWAEADEGIEWVYDDIDQVYSFGVHDSNVFVGTSNGVFCSTNGGSHWTKRDTGITNSNVKAFISIAEKILAANLGIAELPGGIFCSSTQGKSWVSEYTTVPEGFAEIDAILSIGENLLAASAYGGVLLSTDNGTTWRARNNGFRNGHPVSFSLNGSTLLAGCDIDGLFRSSDSGLTWEYIGLDSTGDVIPIQIGTTICTGTGDKGIFRSTDSGASWQSIDSGLDLNQLAFQSLVFNGSFLFAGTNKGIFLLDSGGFWKSSNTGLTTHLVNTMAALGTNLFAGTGDGHTFVDTGGAVFRSLDCGQSWMKVGLDGIIVNSLMVRGTSIFAGTNDGIFVSPDSGMTWFENNSGLTDSFITCLGVVGSNVFAGSFTGICFRRPIMEMIEQSAVSQPSPESQETHSYPNPFSEATKICLTLAEEGYAEVTIVNILGAPVAHIFSGELGAGNHSFTWDAQGAASGCYWCIVRKGGSNEKVALFLAR